LEDRLETVDKEGEEMASVNAKLAEDNKQMQEALAELTAENAELNQMKNAIMSTLGPPAIHQISEGTLNEQR
jgi:hypothetical protein